jgi:maleate cis-trans isomerase
MPETVETSPMYPRYRYGQILPANSAVRYGPGYQFYRIAPQDVIEITTVLGISDYTKDGVDKAIGNFFTCVDLLAREEVGRMVLAGVPISAQRGRDRTRDLLAKAEERTGIPCDAPLESVIAALGHLGVSRVVIGSRWAAELNSAVAGYLTAAGLEVVGSTGRGQWAKEAFGMSLSTGMAAALEVGREAAEIGRDSAEAIFVPGGAALSLHVIPVIEAEAGKPVLTNMNAEVWYGLVRTGVIPPVTGYGALLAGQ